MLKGTHGKNERTFEELSFSDQSKSINGQIRTIEKSIIAHVRKALLEGKDMIDVQRTCAEQLNRLRNRIITN